MKKIYKKENDHMFIKVTQVLIILDLLVLLILNYSLNADAESAVKNKLIDLFAELREVEFVTRFTFRK